MAHDRDGADSQAGSRMSRLAMALMLLTVAWVPLILHLTGHGLIGLVMLPVTGAGLCWLSPRLRLGRRS